MSARVGGALLRRAVKRLSASSEEMEAAELQKETEVTGCQSISSVTDREVVRIFGNLRTVSLAPRGGTPTLEATLYDGSGSVTLVWLGRRRIPGIRPGAALTVVGRVSCQNGQRLIYNPRYELRA